MRNNVNFNLNANKYFVNNEHEEVIVNNNIKNYQKLTNQTGQTGTQSTPNMNVVSKFVNVNNSRANEKGFVSNYLAMAGVNGSQSNTPSKNLISSKTNEYNTSRSPIKNYIFGNGGNAEHKFNFNNFASNPQTSSPQKTNKSFDFVKPPIKKGMFSYPKVGVVNSGGISASPYKQASSVNYSQTSFNNAQMSSLLENSQMPLVGSSSNLLENSSMNMSMPRTFSVEKYQINKAPAENMSVSSNSGFASHPNLINKSVNIIDDSDNLLINSTLRKNDSTSSINLNKYKIHLNPSSALNQTYSLSINDNASTANLQSIKHPSGKVSSSQVTISSPGRGKETEKSHFQTFSSNLLGENFNSPTKKRSLSVVIPHNLTGVHEKVNVMSKNKSGTSLNNSSMNKNNNISQSAKDIKNRSRYEKESRRMLLELVKMKARKEIRSAHSVVEDMSLDSTFILNENSSRHNRSIRHSKSKENLMINQSSLPTNPVINQLSGSVEIKNNNFEINNNFFGNVNPANPDKNVNPLTISKTIPQFLYQMDDEANEKTNLICYLSTPRILHMNLGGTGNSSNKIHKIPFMFQLSPSNLTFTYGFEHYIFQWSDMNSFSPVGSVDVLKIVSCSQNTSKDNIFILDTSKDSSVSSLPSLNQPIGGDNNRYEIIASSSDESRLYVNALNYISQLVKCKAYTFKGNEKLKKKN